jgi:hypothetical protein
MVCLVIRGDKQVRSTSNEYASNILDLRLRIPRKRPSEYQMELLLRLNTVLSRPTSYSTNNPQIVKIYIISMRSCIYYSISLI